MVAQLATTAAGGKSEVQVHDWSGELTGAAVAGRSAARCAIDVVHV